MMSKEQMTEVELSTNVKWGKDTFRAGRGTVPTAALDDLRAAGVLVEDPAAASREPAALTDEQIAAVRDAVAGLKPEDVKADGTPKVAAVNAALKAGGSELVVTAAQLATVPPLAATTPGA